jgi:uncharacterized protein
MDFLAKLKNIPEVQPYPLLFTAVSGSHLYGFSSIDSDFDVRGVHILPLREVVGIMGIHDTIESSKVVDGMELDLVTYDLTKFILLMLQKNGLVLEQLFSPLIIQAMPEHAELKAIAPKVLTRHHIHHYVGFANAQWKLFLRDEPRRVKPILYTFRVLLSGIYLMQTGQIESNLVNLNQHFNLSYVPELIERKISGHEQGTLESADVEFYESEFNRLIQALYTAQEQTHLPEAPSAKAELNELLIKIRGVK